MRSTAVIVSRPEGGRRFAPRAPDHRRQTPSSRERRAKHGGTGAQRADQAKATCYFRESVSHIERRGRLLVVGTPIGNLEDLSPRARRALSEADVIFCEDTRVTAKLAARFSIPAPRISCPAPREGARVEELLDRLSRGETVALVSDAGMPGMSDPGERLVAAAAEAGHVVEVVPGPSAPAAALAISGLPAVNSV